MNAAAEGATKSQIDFNVTEVALPAQVIVGWLRISNQMLEDVPSLVSFLQNRLLEELLKVEDAQLLSGTGVSPNLLGINTAGNFTAATGAATIDPEQLVQGIAQLAALSHQPSAIILNPSDYYAITLLKAASSGDYSLPNVITVTPEGVIRIAGVPVVWTVAQTAGTFTVGDFQNGTTLFYRDTPRIEFFNQDGNNAVQNKITVRIEERIALAVYGASYIIKGTF